MTSRRLFNNARTTKLDSSWEDYKVSLQSYKKELRSAKRRNCESIESAAEVSRLRKFVSISPQPSCLLTKADNSYTHSEKESLNLLLDIHFPSSESIETKILAGICSNAHAKHDKITDNILTPENLNWAIIVLNHLNLLAPTTYMLSLSRRRSRSLANNSSGYIKAV